MATNDLCYLTATEASRGGVTIHDPQRALDGYRLLRIYRIPYGQFAQQPGIHPGLCDMVPIYREGVMAANELLEAAPDASASIPPRPR